jgi:transcriptional regulator with XRE-family HTH domain
VPSQQTQVRAIQREIGRRIRAARDAAKLTQEAAAGKAEIDYKRVQRIEAGTANVTIRTLVRLAAALGTDFWGLVRARRPRTPRG